MDEIDQLRKLRAGLPGPREEARNAARAALMERVGPSRPQRARRRWNGRPALATAGAACLATAAILILIGSAGGPSVRPEIAKAGELRHLAKVFPRLQIAGGWQIVSTEGTAGGGRMVFRDEMAPSIRAKFKVSPRVEIQWRSLRQAQRMAKLLAEGFVPAGQMRVKQARPVMGWVLPFKFRPVDVSAYVSGSTEEGLSPAVALWHEGDRAFELRASVGSVDKLWRLAERVQVLGVREWLIALKPGGGRYLTKSNGGLPTRVEKVKIGEKPNGKPIYRTHTYFGATNNGVAMFEARNVTTIVREGEKVRVAAVLVPPK